MPTLSVKSLPAVLGGAPTFSRLVPITLPTLSPSSAFWGQARNVLASGKITSGRHVREFEEDVQNFLRVKHAIALGSCTAGLMLFLRVMGKRGKVLVPSFTFCATAHAVMWAGLEPVFVDCDPSTYNIDCTRIPELLTSDVLCILGVHLFGNPAPVSSLESLAKRNGIRLLFDAAHAFGARHQQKKVGGFGDAEVFSLSPTKLLTAAEGGMLTTNDDALAKLIRTGRNYGNPGNYNCQFPGLSSRMSEWNALLGRENLKYVEANVNKRQRLVALYKKTLDGIPGLSYQKIQPGDLSTYKDFSVLVNEQVFGMNRNALANSLRAENIETRNYFDPPVHQQDAYRAWRKRAEGRLPMTERLSLGSLSLPLYSHMPKETVRKISSSIARLYENRRNLLNKMRAKIK